MHLYLWPVIKTWLRALPEIILGGGGAQTFFVMWVEGVFVDNVSEGWGGGEVTYPGGQGVFDP